MPNRFAGLYIRNHSFTKSAIFAVYFEGFPIAPPSRNFSLSYFLGFFYLLVVTECRHSKNFSFYGTSKLNTFESSILFHRHYHHLHLVIQTLRFLATYNRLKQANFGTQLLTNIPLGRFLEFFIEMFLFFRYFCT